ncbi:MAG: phosphoribosylanthranilate isomerase [Alphaproteobacteria bacterium]|nr:phosphoribosylanthranilate isomerase [Alphaproteobacteria bacterium]
MTIKVKICGITKPTDIETLKIAQADFAGFVFFPNSPRHLSYEMAKTLAAALDPSIKKVAVLVNPNETEISRAIAAIKPDYIQLHGQETVAMVAQIKEQTGLKIIKAFGIATQEDIENTNQYEAYVDMFLFDAKPAPDAVLPGGTGTQFDWQLATAYNGKTDWMLSGGLTEDNIAEALKITKAKMLDVSSGVESAPGQKDSSKIQQFIRTARANA